MIVTIAGAGRLAEGIAVRVLAAGHELRLTDREPDKARALAASLAVMAGLDAGGPRPTVMGVAKAIAGADIFVLALPYPQGRQVARDQGAALYGSVVVDTCNPVDFSTFDSLLTSPGMSAAEEIAEANPAARVVKAFNTTFQEALMAGSVGGLPLDVFLASDDQDAKIRVASLVKDCGMRPVDTGPLRRARELEAFQLLHMTLQGPLGLDWSSAIKLLPLAQLASCLSSPFRRGTPRGLPFPSPRPTGARP
jgi:predicted dinucleotide-binding enzyme